MSIILEALQKSERKRQALKAGEEPESPELPLREHEYRPRNYFLWWMFSALIMLLAFVALIAYRVGLWSIQAPIVDAKSELAVSAELPTDNSLVVSKSPDSSASAPEKQAAEAIAAGNSLSQLHADRQGHKDKTSTTIKAISSEPQKAGVTQVVSVKETAKLSQQKTVRGPNNMPNVSEMPPEAFSQDIQTDAVAGDHIETREEAVALGGTGDRDNPGIASIQADTAQAEPPPAQHELDNDFQQKIPQVKVNALAYDPDPNRRFAVINMTKYRQGQMLKDNLLIKEIRPDGLVVEFEGKTFRLNNP